jgi:hypothetical protein
MGYVAIPSDDAVTTHHNASKMPYEKSRTNVCPDRYLNAITDAIVIAYNPGQNIKGAAYSVRPEIDADPHPKNEFKPRVCQQFA